MYWVFIDILMKYNGLNLLYNYINMGIIMGLMLLDALRDIPTEYYDEEYNSITLPQDHLFPGFITVLAAFCKKNKISERDFDTAGPEQSGYLRAIEYYKTLWGIDNYGPIRVNQGKNYSGLAHLDNEEQVDSATTCINSCIRAFIQGCKTPPPGLQELLFVVGELHDNVWSHGKASGFSLAQKTKNPLNRNDYIIEFALADHGYGFLSELKRSKLTERFNIVSHRDALDWCLKEGNSSKHADLYDGWEQSVPRDFNGYAFSSSVSVRDDDNNHQGLGLAHLIKLVEKYNGELQIASGDVCLVINGHERNYEDLPVDWKGVAISCRLSLEELSNNKNEMDVEADDDELSQIMTLLQSGDI
ncbi:hypothetical protein [Providencia rustigianii]|uniref:hypothetical protein n=1 Tax=Providencia rustigianii TaxID=158850 RepID=UPI00223ED2F4|nr:hypothetical protein [Providencia rustigianii]